jgi:hypothetical protein
LTKKNETCGKEEGITISKKEEGIFGNESLQPKMKAGSSPKRKVSLATKEGDLQQKENSNGNKKSGSFAT